MDRTIMHVDMDAFYASVELRHRPELAGTPVIVGGSPRGVVLSATYEARAAGVRSGMSSTQARRLCPKATFIHPEFDQYSAVSQAIVEVFRSFSAVVESASIDEAFLDLTGSLRSLGSPSMIGERIRAMVADEQRIHCSVGIGPNKFIAKIGSKQAKPDGLVEVRPDEVVSFLHPLPVEAMWGVGAATSEKLHRLGLFTVADLAHTPLPSLRLAFGPHAGSMLFDLAWGRDARGVVGREPERSVGSQETFNHDTDDPGVVQRELLRMADRTSSRLRQAGFLARTVSVSIRFADFKELTRSAQLASPSDVTEEIYLQAVAIYRKLGLGRARIRRVGVRVENLVESGRASRQPRLTDPERGWREADQAMDAAVDKFGPAAVRRAVLTRPRGRAKPDQ